METASFTDRTRRASLIALAAAGLTRPLAIDAKKKAKKGDANKRCKQQAGDWTILVTAECDGDPGCTGQVKGCCALAGNCDVIGFYHCLVVA